MIVRNDFEKECIYHVGLSRPLRLLEKKMVINHLAMIVDVHPDMSLHFSVDSICGTKAVL